MKQVVVTYEGYTFDELDETAKNRVRSWYAANLWEDWYECVIQDMIDDLAPFGLDVAYKDVSFSGFWSQGDGACFSVSVGTNDVIKYLKETKQSKKYWQLYINLLRDNVDLCFDVKGNDRWGYSMSLGNFDFTPYGKAFDNDSIYNKIYTAAENLAADVLEFCQDKASDLYRDLETEYEYLTSDEQIKESAEANEWLFKKSGKLIY